MDDTHFFSWDTRRDIAHPGDTAHTLAFCVEHFIHCAKEAIKLHGHFAVALSGGSTPKEIFKQLSQLPKAIDWSKVFLFWSDERSVSPTDPDSNFLMAMEAGLTALSIPSEHIFRMHAEENIQSNALVYEQTIRNVLATRPFDLVMLGMGEDGHTASLFPQTHGLKENSCWVIANEVPQKKTWRMTLTYPCINRARNIAIYVLGKSKQAMVKKVFLDTHTPPFPVSHIGTEENKALWIVDTAAGALIFDHMK